MREYRLTKAEQKLADIIWENTPMPSSELVRQCKALLSWKKSTTYTMLKRLEVKELFCNLDSSVTALVTREEFFTGRSKQFVADTFDGSLPRFLTAFTRGEKLSDKEVEELQALIEASREEQL